MNISLSEIVVVFVVALLLFGPEQLPVIARQLGRIAAELRKGSNAIRREFYNSVYQPAEEVRRDILAGGQNLRTLTTGAHSTPQGAPGPSQTSPAPESNASTDEGTPA